MCVGGWSAGVAQAGEVGEVEIGTLVQKNRLVIGCRPWRWRCGCVFVLCGWLWCGPRVFDRCKTCPKFSRQSPRWAQGGAQRGGRACGGMQGVRSAARVCWRAKLVCRRGAHVCRHATAAMRLAAAGQAAAFDALPPVEGGDKRFGMQGPYLPEGPEKALRALPAAFRCRLPGRNR